MITEFPPFRLDSANECLWRRNAPGDEERILLTPTEYGVLKHLVDHAGRLVTHRELLDAVWPRTAIEPQAVKSNIFRLRRALDDDPRQPRFIETLPRRGYRFVGRVDVGAVEHARVPASPGHLVGREHALDALRRCMRDASVGRQQVVFVTGEPGLGKTALVETFQRQLTGGDDASRDGAARAVAMRVARGQCVEGFGSKEPFYPALEAVGQLCRGPDGARMVETLASQAPTWLVQFPALLTPDYRETLRQEILGATRERMLREICVALEMIATPKPLLLVLEDLHWADPSTLDLISALARRRVPSRIMIVATYRPADVSGPAQPLHALKRDLSARQLCEEIALQPLTEAEIAEYLAAEEPGAEVPNELASLLHRHTEGNPLFVVTILEHLVARGLVERDRASWRLLRPAAEISVEVPDSLREMIAAQIDRLDESEQRVLEVASIAGMSFAPAICASSADMDVAAFSECCDTLARRGQIVRRAGTQELLGHEIVQRYEFVHALYREVLSERQAPARRAMLHRRYAERMEELSAAPLDEVAPELARHFELGGDWARAINYLRRFSVLAARRGSLDGAIGTLEHALTLAAKLPAERSAREETEILDSLADMYLGTFDARAADALTRLRDLAAEHGFVDVEAKALVDLIYPVAWVSGERALGVIEQALRLSEQQRDPLARARTRARCMTRRIWTRGWSADDAAECARALADIRRLGAPQLVAWHVIDCSVVDFFASAYRTAMQEVIERLGALVDGQSENTYLSYAHSLRELIVPWCLTLLGEWGAALREADAGIALAEKNGDPARVQTQMLSRAWTLLHAMDFAGARAHCETLLSVFQHPARAPWRRFCLAIAGAAEAGLGDHERALDLLQRLRAEMDGHAALGDWYWRLQLGCALGNLWLSRGDLDRARDEGERFLADAAATAERTYQALAWDTNARIALAAGDARLASERVARALAAVDGGEAPVAGWRAHATAADVAIALDDEAGAARHRHASREIVRHLAASLGPNDALRRTFLAAPSVASVTSTAVR
jgi:DNA-binding winged helix-turn-helix (wHTH) protein